MKLSVIVPCYNAAKFLRETLESILHQDMRETEIICIDDGSTDETLKLLEEYPVRILKHPKGANRGQSASINLGLREAKGKYIAFCDADDIWFEGKIAAQIRCLDSFLEVGLVFCNGSVINEHSERQYPLNQPWFILSQDPEDLLISPYIKTPSQVMFRKELLQSVGLFAPFQPSDHDFWLRLKEKTMFAYISLKLVGYRKHSQQISHRRRQWEDGFQVLKRAIVRYKYSLLGLLARRGILHFRLWQHDLKNKKLVRSGFHVVAALTFLLVSFYRLRAVFKLRRGK